MLKSRPRLSSRFLLPLVVLLAAALYLPSLYNGYVGWDDAIIRQNSAIRSLGPENLARIFVPRSGASYQPLRDLAYAVVFALGGSSPLGYLVLNILLYALNVFLFYLVVRLLLLAHGVGQLRQNAGRAALLAAAVFSIHPVHVEVVSWLQGGKFALMAALFLASFFFYLRCKIYRKPLFLWISFFLYLAALVTQPGALALPLLLAGYEMTASVQAERRSAAWWKSLLVRLAPFALPALVMGAHLAFFSNVRLNPGSAVELGLRLFTVPLLWLKYLGKLLLPVNLCCRYPLAPGGSFVPGAAAALVLVPVGWAAYRAAGSSRIAALAMVWFAAALLPTSGLVPISTLMADRYLYLSSMAFSLWTAAAIFTFHNRFLTGGPGFRLSSVWLAALLLGAAAGWGGITLRRQADWRDPFTLWSRVVEIYPSHSLANFNLAYAFQQKGEQDRAVKYYLRALDARPDYYKAYINLGIILRSRGENRKALDMFERARELDPGRGELWVNLGVSRALLGQDLLALDAFGRAVGLGGKARWSALYNRGKLLIARGREQDGIDDLGQALIVSPDLVTAEAWLDVGRTLESLGRTKLARDLMERGRKRTGFDARCWRLLANLQLLDGSPGDALASLDQEARLNQPGYESLVLKGAAAQQAGKLDLAVEAYRDALGLEGADSVRILNNLGSALAAAGRFDEAERAYRLALDSSPAYLESWVNLGLLYQSTGRQQQARESFERALALAGNNPEFKDLAGHLQTLLGQVTGR